MQETNQQHILDSFELIKDSMQQFKCKVNMLNNELAVLSEKEDFIKIFQKWEE